jgi:hypothetical protein
MAQLLRAQVELVDATAEDDIVILNPRDVVALPPGGSRGTGSC